MTPVVMDGFSVNRAIKSLVGANTRAEATLTTTGGTTFALHVSGKGVPSIGRRLGKNWALHIDDHNVPTIVGRYKP